VKAVTEEERLHLVCPDRKLAAVVQAYAEGGGHVRSPAALNLHLLRAINCAYEMCQVVWSCACPRLTEPPTLCSPSCPAQGDGEVSFCGAIEMSGFLELRCGAALPSSERLNTEKNCTAGCVARSSAAL